ncbi:putative transcription factor bZIP family [Helianthus annuus]|uniref:Transcription factor bZIP family n=1 Tax=Helianthus annuus TaxID=4232 RepID=A0A251UW44_HELAN|nr:probable inactive serine/threonine-protein kinase roco10 [Helianthus annuus]KAF5808267.1 putative transcription factor bZIP family [Helianthus annuus]KAJ0595436.1 putative transcription factor bZIP family [Helianthus annuus]KAJ0925038.1 putative transcription factor bZIP family [Helianthus annuus]
MNNNNNNNDDDNWVKSAIDDVNLVVHLLLKLRHPSPPPPKTWTIRQRRSRPPPPPTTTTTNKPSATRASPTTPLSWSGATSVSGGGVEESSRLIHDGSETRSKVIRANETTPTKRPRKKKTLVELKEDEMTLLKERKQLKRQLATLQATFQKHREENESLKKMKNDLKSQQVLAVSDCVEEEKNDSFVLPDLNIPAAGEECC